MASNYWYSSLRPIFPGKIGCGVNFNLSHRRTADVYRSDGARERRRLRKQYQKQFRGKGPGLRAWIRGLEAAA